MEQEVRSFWWSPGSRLCGRSLGVFLTLVPACLPPLVPVIPGGGVSGRCPPFLRDVAGVAGGGGFWPLSDLAPSLWASVYPPVEWTLDPRGPSSMWCCREAASVTGAGG